MKNLVDQETHEKRSGVLYKLLTPKKNSPK